ncbi:LamG-like jellyroll fold domain-containing protein, partial [Verrucomicrobiota bacterium]
WPRVWSPFLMLLGSFLRRRVVRLTALMVVVCLVAVLLYARLGPLGPARLLKRANVMFSTGRCRKAAETYEQAMAAGASKLYVYQQLGECYEALEEWSEAAEWYGKWVQTEPSSVKARLKLGWACYEQKDYERAIPEFIEVSALDVNEAEAYQGLGLSYCGLKRYRDAVEPLNEWVGLKPNSFDAHRWLGTALSRSGSDLIKAIAHLKRAAEQSRLASAQETALVWAALGETCSLAGRVQEGIAAYEKFGEFNPELKRRLAVEDRKYFEMAYVQYGLIVRKRSMIFDLDFLGTHGENKQGVVVSRTGQEVKIEGPVRIVTGPRNGSHALAMADTTRISLPSSVLNLSEGSLVMWACLTDLVKTYSDLIRVNNDTDLYIYRQRSRGALIVFYNNVHIGAEALSISDHKWHFYAFTWREGEQKLYVDGRNRLAGCVPASSAKTENVAIGWLGDRDGEQWGGEIAECLIYDRELTAPEVEVIWSLGLQPVTQPE